MGETYGETRAVAVLDVVDVTKRFAGVQALDGVTMSLVPGRVLGVIGPNGAGKSTLINVISGLFHPSSGHITFDGSDVGRTPLDERARRGLVRSFQNTRTFASLTVAEALRLAAEAPRPRALGVDRSEIDELLADFGLAPFSRQTAGALPYGAQKVLNLAMVALAHPLALLLDEPFAGVDASDVYRLSEVIDQLRRRQVAIGLVEHNIEALLRLADDVTVIDSGRTIFDGSPEEARTSEIVRTAYLGHGAAARRTRR